MAAVRGREAEGIELYFSDFPDEIKKAMAISLAEKNERIQSELRQVKEQLAVNAPKVEAFEEFIYRKDTYSFNDVSKLLGIQHNKLLAYLESVGLITKFKKPSSRAVTKGIVVQKITDWGKQTRITPVGIDYIRKNYKNYLERNIVK
ncbi:phage antirepressor KilAC domain-containing protein [Clostridioides difficile]|uniref:phage antirepressor KilAC domain-containing protein n=1 Tax=Clostridioides difficile TaxID=1496 RepID=UPI001C1DC45A|nr:phage antirepressor KilAC domain-containing protein [Clostridioides difficile]HBF6291372.1 phage antirepressor KilAC domain-containing protein [Clostridioides difficile]HBG4071398.1 phage antirepressor KilAC domain-containing protein [Clostridioides difficile]HBY2690100.1 phage antirepressor KilAC domain-containing protein [Clostridioides difficile]HDO9121452.1 phage antirepressor KilAC domain-containing protein [Clostridioides difficile]